MKLPSEKSNSEELRRQILAAVSRDLLSLPPLISRSIRRQLVRPTTAGPDLNITPLHYEIMRLLEIEGTLHVSEIGDKLLIARAQMTKLIDKLVNLNIVERIPDKSDRRTLNISLTGQGLKLLNEHQNRVIYAVREILSPLSDEDPEVLSRSLPAMRSILLKA
jgi:DNA-binding MarR family transcriptional regulator